MVDLLEIGRGQGSATERFENLVGNVHGHV